MKRSYDNIRNAIQKGKNRAAHTHLQMDYLPHTHRICRLSVSVHMFYIFVVAAAATFVYYTNTFSLRRQWWWCFLLALFSFLYFQRENSAIESNTLWAYSDKKNSTVLLFSFTSRILVPFLGCWSLLSSNSFDWFHFICRSHHKLPSIDSMNSTQIVYIQLIKYE